MSDPHGTSDIPSKYQPKHAKLTDMREQNYKLLYSIDLCYCSVCVPGLPVACQPRLSHDYGPRPVRVSGDAGRLRLCSHLQE